MRKKYLFTSLFILMLGLIVTACEFTISGNIDFPNLEVSNARYATNYRTDEGRSVICDDRTTELTYSFDYQGDLDRWSSYLEGSRGGRVGERTFYPDYRGYGAAHVEVTYGIPPYTAPLSVDPNEGEVTPQAIVVVPKPVVIGHTTLYLSVNGYGSRAFSSDPIPVINNCR